MTEPLSDDEFLKRHFRCWHFSDVAVGTVNVWFVG